jgi:hypothetical protein
LRFCLQLGQQFLGYMNVVLGFHGGR